jgi:hypothetical protein
MSKRFVVPSNDEEAQAVQPMVFYHHSEQRVFVIMITRGKSILMETRNWQIFAFLFFRKYRKYNTKEFKISGSGTQNALTSKP